MTPDISGLSTVIRDTAITGEHNYNNFGSLADHGRINSQFALNEAQTGRPTVILRCVKWSETETRLVEDNKNE